MVDQWGLLTCCLDFNLLFGLCLIDVRQCGSVTFGHAASVDCNDQHVVNDAVQVAAVGSHADTALPARTQVAFVLSLANLTGLGRWPVAANVDLIVFLN